MPNDYKLTERAVLLAKVEAGGYGVDPIPTASDAIITGLVSLEINGEKISRLSTHANFSPLSPRIGIKDLGLSFEMEIRGLGSAYTALLLPEISPLMRACSFGETVDLTPASENVVYAPVSDNIESCTIYFYEDGILYKATGCRGDVEFGGEFGKTVIAKFSMQALYTEPIDAALITGSPADPSVLPPVIFSGGLTIGAYTPVVSKFMFKMGNSIAKRPDVNHAQGYREIFINGREPVASLDPELDTLATKNFFSEWEASTAQALALTVGAVQYNKVSFAAPKAVYDNLTPGEREKLRTLDIPMTLVGDTGDDELVITFA